MTLLIAKEKGLNVLMNDLKFEKTFERPQGLQNVWN